MNWSNIKRISVAALLTLAVVVALGATVLVALAPQVTHCGDMRRTKAVADVAAISEALALFRREHGTLPSSDEGLRALVETASPSTGEGYLWKIPVDPWGRPYRYSTDGKTFSLVSLGADGAKGGDGANEDITSDGL
jgi:general secretion pathway protein G